MSAKVETDGTPYIAWPPELQAHLDKLYSLLYDWSNEGWMMGLPTVGKEITVSNAFMDLTIRMRT